MGLLSCMQWNLSIVDTTGTQLAVLFREVSLNSEVNLYTTLCGWDCRQCSHWRGVSPLFRVAFIERFHCTPNTEVQVLSIALD